MGCRTFLLVSAEMSAFPALAPTATATPVTPAAPGAVDPAPAAAAEEAALGLNLEEALRERLQALVDARLRSRPDENGGSPPSESGAATETGRIPAPATQGQGVASVDWGSTTEGDSFF